VVRRETSDERGVLVAVALGDADDQLLADVTREVEVDVRGGDQLPVEEAAEREAGGDRVDVVRGRSGRQTIEPTELPGPGPGGVRAWASPARAQPTATSRASSSTSQWRRKNPASFSSEIRASSSRSRARACRRSVSRRSGRRRRARRPFAAGRRESRTRRRNPGTGSQAPRSGRKVRPAATSAVRSTASRSRGTVEHRVGGWRTASWFPRRSALTAVQRGAAADRDERVLEAARGARGEHGRRRSRRWEREVPRELAEPRRCGARPALVRPLELDVEVVSEGGRDARCGVRVAPRRAVAGAAREADEAVARLQQRLEREGRRSGSAPPSVACRRARRSGAGRGWRSPSRSRRAG